MSETNIEVAREEVAVEINEKNNMITDLEALVNAREKTIEKLNKTLAAKNSTITELKTLANIQSEAEACASEAKSTHTIYKAYIEAGFSEEQAWEIVKNRTIRRGSVIYKDV